ncbi:TPA: hypothetical protein ACK0FJ_002175 [Staphylococcus aureus]
MNKGDKYNRLTALKEVDKRKWLFQCTCGNKKIISKYDVQKGHTQSCGCLHKENVSKAKKNHGDTDSRLYYIWENMRKRCYKPNSDRYKNYGARGITICDEWKNDYSNFYKWSYNNGYNDNLTIERIDINGNYEPKNCTWITIEEQAKNRSSSKWVYLDGIKYSPHELENIYKIPIKTIYARIARGDKGYAVVRPLGKRQFYKR